MINALFVDVKLVENGLAMNYNFKDLSCEKWKKISI